MVGPGAPTVAELAAFGVTRISVGPAISGAAYGLAAVARNSLLLAPTALSAASDFRHNF